MKNGSAVTPAVTALLVAVLIGFIGFLAYRNFGPKQADAGMSFGAKASLSDITPQQLETIRKEFDAAKANRGATASGN